MPDQQEWAPAVQVAAVEFERCRNQLRALVSSAGSSEQGAPVRLAGMAAIDHLDELEGRLHPFWDAVPAWAATPTQRGDRLAGHRRPAPQRRSWLDRYRAWSNRPVQ